MHIASFAQYKSLPPIAPVALPTFTVLTGLNGTGKSQLLAGLQTQAIRCDLFGPLTPPAPAPGSPTAMPPSMLPSGHPQITLLKHWSASDSQFGSERNSKLGARFGPVGGVTPHTPVRMYEFDAQRAQLLRPSLEHLEGLLGQPMPTIIGATDDPWRLGEEELAKRVGFSCDDQRLAAMGVIFAEAVKSITTTKHMNPMSGMFVSEVLTAAAEFKVSALSVDLQMLDDIKNRVTTEMFQPDIVEVFGAYRDELAGNDLDELEARRNPTKSFLRPDEFVARYGVPPWERSPIFWRQ